MASDDFARKAGNIVSYLEKYFLYIVLLAIVGILIVRREESVTLGAALTACIILIAIGTDNIAKFSLGPKGFELERVQEQINKNSDIINRFIFLSMPMPTYKNLKKFSSGDFGSYVMTETFRQQIRYLRDNGFVSVQGYVGQIPDKGDQLSRYVHATSTGEQFIKIRENLSC